MEKDLFTVYTEEVEKDITLYLSTSIAHCIIIISTLEKLSNNQNEKEHIADILKECQYYYLELSNLQKEYISNNSIQEKNILLTKIQEISNDLFNIEEELISDYPDKFINNDGHWSYYQTKQFSQKNVNIVENVQNIEEKSNNKIRSKIKEFSFGLFFLFPIFFLFIFYFWANDKFKVQEDTLAHPIKYEYDRAYKNIFYIYSAVLSSSNNNDNFYTIIKNNHFVMPEGFVVIDKNVIVDYYLKEYYSISNLETQPDITIVSVNNLNYIQCQYILTKFSGMNFYAIILNNQPLSSSDKTSGNTCLSENNKSNIISLYIKK